MPYALALANAELDAEMISDAVVEQDADDSSIVIMVRGAVVGVYPYKD